MHQGKLMATPDPDVVESGFTVKSTSEHAAIVQLIDEGSLISAKAIVAEASQLDTSGRVLSLAEIEYRDAQMVIAIDDELEQVELLLENSNRLNAWTLAIKAADELLAKRERIKAAFREVSISQAKMAQVEAVAAESLLTAAFAFQYGLLLSYPFHSKKFILHSPKYVKGPSPREINLYLWRRPMLCA